MSGSQAPNLIDSHLLVDEANGVTVLPAHKHRTFFMVINNDAQEIRVHIGRFDSDGIIIDAMGGHLTLDRGVYGPIYLEEGSGGSASVTVISSLDEEAHAEIQP